MTANGGVWARLSCRYSALRGCESMVARLQRNGAGTVLTESRTGGRLRRISRRIRRRHLGFGRGLRRRFAGVGIRGRRRIGRPVLGIRWCVGGQGRGWTVWMHDRLPFEMLPILASCTPSPRDIHATPS
jgi:hypothetical protein